MSGRKKSVNTVAFFNILGPIILNGINFFVIPLFTRLLGTDNYGIYTIYSTWLNVLTIIISLQVHGTISVAFIEYEEEKEEYCSSIMSIMFISFAVMLGIFGIFIGPIAKFIDIPEIMVIVLVVNAFAMAIINFMTTKFTYSKDAHKTFLTSVGIAISGLGLSLILINMISDSDYLYAGRVFGAAIPYIILALILAASVFLKGKKLYVKKYWKFCLPLCLPLIFHGISYIILGQADKIMLQKMTDDSTVGVFGFTVSFVQIINIIYNALNTTWMPFYFDDLHAGNFERIEKRTKNYVFLYSIITMGFVLLAPEVIKLFVEEEFQTGIKIIPILALGYYMIFLYSFPTNFQFFHKKSKHIATGTVGAAIINCILNYFMIKSRGMAGAAEATFLAYGVLWIFHMIISKYVIKKEYHYKLKTFLVPLIIVSIVCFGSNFLLDYAFIRWAIGIALGCILIYRIYKQRSIF